MTCASEGKDMILGNEKQSGLTVFARISRPVKVGAIISGHWTTRAETRSRRP